MEKDQFVSRLNNRLILIMFSVGIALICTTQNERMVKEILLNQLDVILCTH